jgi:hypothetical protein
MGGHDMARGSGQNTGTPGLVLAVWLGLWSGCSDDAPPPDPKAVDSAATADTTAATDVVVATDSLLADGGTTDVAAVTDAIEPAEVEDTGVGSDTAGQTDATTKTDAVAATDVVAATDAAATSDASAGSDADGVADAGGCPPPSSYDYTCDAKIPSTCPGGTCLLGLCIGPQLDPKRWDGCGNGSCEPCETGCPADCGPAVAVAPGQQYSGDKTITVWVHGFSNQGPDKLKQLTYGSVKGCGDVFGMMQAYGINRPCGDSKNGETDPTQLVAVEYYGEQPPAWMTAADIAEVEKYPFSGGPLGLQRYALITAKFAKWRMALSGATHVQFACHSMGCLVTRQLIETDLEGLGSQGKIVRWFTSTGVIAGAKLSRLFNNDTVQQTSTSIGLEVSDFILMNPDYVWDTTAVWDHKLHEANNPLFQGVLMHHVGATDPKIAEALNIQLLDLLGGGNEPNDGIMYTEDMYFWNQADSVAFKAVGGEAVRPGLTLVNVDHMTCPETEATGLLATAALFHQRKVEVKLVSFKLLNDLEKDNLLDFSQEGNAPAEVALEIAARFNPYVKKTWDKNVLVHDSRLATRTAPLWEQSQGQTLQPNAVVFQGPVLDEMKEMWLSVQLVEVDQYGPKQILENIGDPSDELLGFTGEVPLVDGHTWTVKNANGEATFAVRVWQLY